MSNTSKKYEDDHTLFAVVATSEKPLEGFDNEEQA